MKAKLEENFVEYAKGKTWEAEYKEIEYLKENAKRILFLGELHLEETKSVTKKVQIILNEYFKHDCDLYIGTVKKGTLYISL